MNNLPDFIRPNFKRPWHHQKFPSDNPLAFCGEAERYLSKAPVGASVTELSLEVADQMKSYGGQPIISAIPCFALESPSITALPTIPSSFW